MDWMIWMFAMIAVVSVGGQYFSYLEKSKGLGKGANKRELEEIRDSLDTIKRQLSEMDERVADLTLMLDDAPSGGMLPSDPDEK